MASHKVLIVPPEVDQPCVLYDMADGDTDDLRTIIFGPNPAYDVTVDFGTFARPRFEYVVDGFSLMNGSPINPRAIQYVREVTEDPDAVSYGIAGICVFLGFDQDGNPDDVPFSILKAAGVTPPHEPPGFDEVASSRRGRDS